MYRKNLAAGASSGLVFTQDFDLYRRALSLSDRGKPLWRLDLNLKDPGHAFFPALNWNSSEMSNAIGLASLRRLDETNQKRRNFLELLIAGLDERRSACKPMAYHSGFAPFYFPLLVDQTRVTVDAEKFALAVQAEGITLGAKYGCIVSTWPWAENLVVDTFVPVNAISARDRSFNLHLNENYGPTEVRDILDSIDKVSEAYPSR
jgi:dTDP-4-amino-4,6-dideoxygalactose transaminase